MVKENNTITLSPIIPKSYIDFGKIKNVRDISPQDIKKLDDIFNLDLVRKQKEFAFKCKKGIALFLFGILILFFIASFSAVMGWIDNTTLKSYFEESIIVILSSVVGFALGYCYNQIK